MCVKLCRRYFDFNWDAKRFQTEDENRRLMREVQAIAAHEREEKAKLEEEHRKELEKLQAKFQFELGDNVMGNWQQQTQSTKHVKPAPSSSKELGDGFAVETRYRAQPAPLLNKKPVQTVTSTETSTKIPSPPPILLRPLEIALDDDVPWPEDVDREDYNSNDLQKLIESLKQKDVGALSYFLETKRVVDDSDKGKLVQAIKENLLNIKIPNRTQMLLIRDYAVKGNTRNILTISTEDALLEYIRKSFILKTKKEWTAEDFQNICISITRLSELIFRNDHYLEDFNWALKHREMLQLIQQIQANCFDSSHTRLAFIQVTRTALVGYLFSLMRRFLNVDFIGKELWRVGGLGLFCFSLLLMFTEIGSYSFKDETQNVQVFIAQTHLGERILTSILCDVTDIFKIIESSMSRLMHTLHN